MFPSGAYYTPVEVQFRTIAMDFIGRRWSMRCATRPICWTTSSPSIPADAAFDCERSLQNIEVQMQNIHRDINGAPQVGEAPKTSD